MTTCIRPTCARYTAGGLEIFAVISSTAAVALAVYNSSMPVSDELSRHLHTATSTLIGGTGVFVAGASGLLHKYSKSREEMMCSCTGITVAALEALTVLVPVTAFGIHTFVLQEHTDAETSQLLHTVAFMLEACTPPLAAGTAAVVQRYFSSNEGESTHLDSSAYPDYT